jgi:hypothetical protein
MVPMKIGIGRRLKEVTMKFVMVVLAIHFIGEVIGNKRKKIKDKRVNERNELVLHPAEYILR